jgi:phosphoribosylanthranilate isomerase
MAIVRVKICGITRLEDAICASDAGADALGFNFYRQSPRMIEKAAASSIINDLPPFISKVGLFVNDSPEYIRSIIKQVKLDFLQFHGDEDQEECLQYGIPYIKAIKMREDVDLGAMVSIFEESAALLTDSYVPGIPGGTGKTFDWSLLNQQVIKPIILAGGLTPENVGEAIRRVHPYSVDVSGGVESKVGIKDKNKILKFIQNAKDLVL